jgi:hypothetical protein
MRLAALAALLLTACPGPVDTADSGGPGEPVELWGTVTDPYLALAPVDGAWVLLDLGDEQIGVRTGSDGSFSMPGLPGSRPISITVALEGHMAVTYSDVVLAEVTMPLDLRTHARDLASYATETMTISGSVSGAPVGSYVMFFGPTDADLGTSYLDYVQVSSEDPVEYEIEVELVLPSTDYALSALAFDGTSWVVQAAAAGTVTWGGSETLDFALDPEALQELAVSATPPILEGVPVAGIDEDYCSSMAVTQLGESMSTTTGYNRGCDDSASPFELDVGWASTEGFTDRLQIYMFDDYTTGTYAFGSLPIPDGASSLDVTLLDSPLLEHHDELSQGGSITWDPVEGVTGYMLYGYDGDGSLAWYLYPGTTDESFTFPRFPADFDASQILVDGNWAVIARHVIYADDGALDQSEAYTGSISHGGQLFL